MRMREAMPVDQSVEIGSYTFTPENIVEFASDFDPQFFHLDAERAKDSVFGGLCASGWHICAAMMKCNVAFLKAQAKALLAEGMAPPKIGPSPGFRNLKWLKPAFAGDTMTYSARYIGDRPIPNRPGRFFCDVAYEGRNQHGDVIFSVECSVVEFE
jgi:acyl dehydratase